QRTGASRDRVHLESWLDAEAARSLGALGVKVPIEPAGVGAVDPSDRAVDARAVRAPVEGSHASPWVATQPKAPGLQPSPPLPRLGAIRRALLGWVDGARTMAEIRARLHAEFGADADAAVDPIVKDLKGLGLLTASKGG